MNFKKHWFNAPTTSYDANGNKTEKHGLLKWGWLIEFRPPDPGKRYAFFEIIKHTVGIEVYIYWHCVRLWRSQEEKERIKQTLWNRGELEEKFSWCKKCTNW